MNVDMIGLIDKMKNSYCYSVLSSIQDLNFKVIELHYKPSSILVLPNGYLACCCIDQNIWLYDNELKEVASFNNNDGAMYLTSNNQDRIYMSELEGHKVKIADLNFNQIKSVGSYGDSNEQFDTPCGIFFYKDYVYVCEYGNKRIQKLNAELEFIHTYQFNYPPIQIVIINDLACINSASVDSNGNDVYLSLRFYDINNFSLKQVYDDHSGTLSVLNSYFFECCTSEKVYCYNKWGELLKSIEFSHVNIRRSLLDKENDGCLVEFNNSFILSCGEAESLVIFKKKNQL